jgi:hypothetical protein
MARSAAEHQTASFFEASGGKADEIGVEHAGAESANCRNTGDYAFVQSFHGSYQDNYN